MTGRTADEISIRAFYTGALVALRYLEHAKPTGRRFGADADARWEAFAGDLELIDRADVLIRDADAEWPGAFGARMVFALGTVAEDDAFGPEWPGLHPPVGAELWKAALEERTPPDPAAVLERVARAWDLKLDPLSIEPVGPAEQLVVTGPSALAAVVAHFVGNADLDWADQVTCVATDPGPRQIAALGAAFTPGVSPTRLLRAGAEQPTPGDRPRLVLSDDATPDDATTARRLAGQEGGC